MAKNFESYISPKHRRVAAMAALGRKQVAIAKATGLSESAVSRILRRPSILEAVKANQKAFFEVASKLVLSRLSEASYAKALASHQILLQDLNLTPEEQLEHCSVILDFFSPVERKKGKPRGRPFLSKSKAD